MKKVVFFSLLLLITIIIFFSCEKDTNQTSITPEPVLIISSIETIKDTTYLTVDINPDYASSIDRVKLYYSSNDFENDSYSTRLYYSYGNLKANFYIVALDPNKEYSFKAFVSTEKIHTYSQIIKYSIPIGNKPSVPCSLANNYIMDDVIVTPVYSTSSSYGHYDGGSYYSIKVFFSEDSEIELLFKYSPTNGIYNTVNKHHSDLAYQEVIMSIHNNCDPYSIIANENGEIYVESLENNTLKISFCNIPYNCYEYNETTGVEKIIKGQFTINKY